MLLAHPPELTPTNRSAKKQKSEWGNEVSCLLYSPLSMATSAISLLLIASLAPKACKMTIELQVVIAALELRLLSGGIVPSTRTLT